MAHTADQEKIVLKILSYKPHQYYEILEVTRTALEGEIKKSYRRLAVRLHPDKNPHPRASEAFKLLNKAWGVLSDPGKKRIFDQTGSDPDARFGQSSSGSAASAFAHQQPFRAQGFGGGFDDDIFNLFFGGGARPGSTFTFGNGQGFTFQSFGNNGFGNGFDPFAGRRQQRQQQRQQQEPSAWETMKQLAPLLLILVATLILTLFSSDATPEYLFARTAKHPVMRTTPRHSVRYFVGDKFTDDKSAQKLRAFDHKVEVAYVTDQRHKCSREQAIRNEMLEEAHGWFYTDKDKVAAAESMPMPHCERLRDMGLL